MYSRSFLFVFFIKFLLFFSGGVCVYYLYTTYQACEAGVVGGCVKDIGVFTTWCQSNVWSEEDASVLQRVYLFLYQRRAAQCGVYWTCVKHVAGWALCLLVLSLLLLVSFLRDVSYLWTAVRRAPHLQAHSSHVQTEAVTESEEEEWLDSEDWEGEEEPLRGEVIREVAGLISQIVVDSAVESTVRNEFRRSRRAVWKGPRGESSRGSGHHAGQASRAASIAAESTRRFIRRLYTVEEEEASDADADPEWKLQTLSVPLSPEGATDDSGNEQEPTEDTLSRERLIASFPSESMCAKARRLICPCVFRTERERAVTACRGCVRTSCGTMHLCRIRRRRPTYYEIYEDAE